MTNLTPDKAELSEKVKKLVSEGKPFTAISKELGISWNEARSYTPNSSWVGLKRRTTHRLRQIRKEPDPTKREEMLLEVIHNVDFLYDAAKHLRTQVDSARKALDR